MFSCPHSLPPFIQWHHPGALRCLAMFGVHPQHPRMLCQPKMSGPLGASCLREKSPVTLQREACHFCHTEVWHTESQAWSSLMSPWLLIKHQGEPQNPYSETQSRVCARLPPSPSTTCSLSIAGSEPKHCQGKSPGTHLLRLALISMQWSYLELVRWQHQSPGMWAH